MRANTRQAHSVLLKDMHRFESLCCFHFFVRFLIHEFDPSRLTIAMWDRPGMRVLGCHLSDQAVIGIVQASRPQRQPQSIAHIPELSRWGVCCSRKCSPIAQSTSHQLIHIGCSMRNGRPASFLSRPCWCQHEKDTLLASFAGWPLVGVRSSR
jgi:hypothetical protein